MILRKLTLASVFIIFATMTTGCAQQDGAKPSLDPSTTRPWPVDVNYKELESLGLKHIKGTPRLDPDLWQGGTRKDVHVLLSAMPEVTPTLEAWPALRPLIISALIAPSDPHFLTDGNKPPPAGEDLFTTRIKALLDIDATKEANLLYETLQGQPPYCERLGKVGITAMISVGQGPLACLEIAMLRAPNGAAARSSDPFWTDLEIRCAPGASHPLPTRENIPPQENVIPKPPVGANLAQVYDGFVRAAAMGQPIPRSWIKALDALSVPQSQRGRRLYALLQAAASVEAGPAEAASRLEAARNALANDKEGSALFESNIVSLLEALVPPVLELGKRPKLAKKRLNTEKNDYGNTFLLTEGAHYVMPIDTAQHDLAAALDDQSAGRVALAVALFLAGQDPGSVHPGVACEAVGALASVGLATAAEGVAVEAILGAAQNL